MNTKTAKKIRKYVRQEAQKKFENGVNILGDLVHKRPKAIPKCIWLLLYIPLFKRKAWRFLYRYI
jgi:hypothetical protein